MKALWSVLLLCACGPQATPQTRVSFVRDGIVTAHGPTQRGQTGAKFTPIPWKPGDRVPVDGQSFTAPERPSCVPLAQVPLANLDTWVARGGASPDGDVRFAPDGSWLAVSSTLGTLLLLDGLTGQLRAEIRIADGFVRKLLVSPDGRTLFAATQAPHAEVLALETSDLRVRWRVDLSPWIGHTPPAAPADPFGRYSLPAAYDLAFSADGDLLVAASLGRRDPAGTHINRGVLLKLDPSGALRAQWPPTDAVGLVLQQVRASQEAVALLVHHTADAPLPPGLPEGGVIVLDPHTLTPLHTIEPAPVTSFEARAWVWEALDLQGTDLLVGLTNGRLESYDTRTGALSWQRDPGAPLPIGPTQVAASVAWGKASQGLRLAVTSSSTIPWRDSAPGATAPALHPGQESLWAYTPDGTRAWVWHHEHAHLQGLWLSNDGDTAIVAGGLREGSFEPSLFGAWVLDTRTPHEGDRERVFCATEGPVHFRFDATQDGRVALVEIPFIDATGQAHGRYQLVLMR